MNKNQFQIDDILETKGGYYDLRDPKYIYINQTLNEELKKEVEAHETFHRTLSSSTIYGVITNCLSIALRNKKKDDSINNDAKELFELRNTLFKEMYLVQESGAIARTYFHLPHLYRINSIEELRRIRQNHINSLIPEYKKIANEYIPFLHELFNFSYSPDFLIHFFNDALTRFCMNSVLFTKYSSIDDLIKNKSEIENHISPDKRFLELINAIKNDISSFRSNMINEFKKAYYVNIEIGMGAACLQHMLLTKGIEFEGFMIDSFDRPLQLFFQNKSIPRPDLKPIIDWLKILNRDLPNYIPNFEPFKFHMPVTEKEKFDVLDLKKEF